MSSGGQWKARGPTPVCFGDSPPTSVPSTRGRPHVHQDIELQEVRCIGLKNCQCEVTFKNCSLFAEFSIKCLKCGKNNSCGMLNKSPPHSGIRVAFLLLVLNRSENKQKAKLAFLLFYDGG